MMGKSCQEDGGIGGGSGGEVSFEDLFLFLS